MKEYCARKADDDEDGGGAALIESGIRFLRRMVVDLDECVGGGGGGAAGDSSCIPMDASLRKERAVSQT